MKTADMCKGLIEAAMMALCQESGTVGAGESVKESRQLASPPKGRSAPLPITDKRCPE